MTRTRKKKEVVVDLKDPVVKMDALDAFWKRQGTAKAPEASPPLGRAENLARQGRCLECGGAS